MLGWSENVEKEREKILHAVSFVYDTAFVSISVLKRPVVLFIGNKMLNNHISKMCLYFNVTMNQLKNIKTTNNSFSDVVSRYVSSILHICTVCRVFPTLFSYEKPLIFAIISALSFQFIQGAEYICLRLMECGFWADFIDPSSGKPVGVESITPCSKVQMGYNNAVFRKNI